MFDFKHVNFSWVITTKIFRGAFRYVSNRIFTKCDFERNIALIPYSEKVVLTFFHCSLMLDGLMEAVAKGTILLGRKF